MLKNSLKSIIRFISYGSVAAFCLQTIILSQASPLPLAISEPDQLPISIPAGSNPPTPLPTGPPASPAPTIPSQASEPNTSMPPTPIDQPTAQPPPPTQTAPEPAYTEYPYQALLTPNDSNYSSQSYLPRIGAPAAWDVTIGSPTVTIAIIDTGFALAHQDLASRWWTNPAEIGPTGVEGPAPNCTSRGLTLDKSCNNLDNDGNGYPSDWRGWDFISDDNSAQAGTTNPAGAAAAHGTLVAGLAAATGNNSVGLAGINWNSRIMPLQALDDNGSGYTSTVANAVDYAVANGADIINLSLGANADDPYLHQRITAAITQGVTVVAAAGNTNCNCLVYPANYPEVISVGSTDQNDVRSSFSSYGQNLDVMAPGSGGICSTSWISTNGTSSYSCSYQGTSFASPITAGIASLILSRHPAASPRDIERFIRAGASKVAGMGASTQSLQYGYGRVNIYNSLVQAALPASPGQAADKQLAGNVSLTNGPDVVSVCSSNNGACGLRLTGPNNEIRTISPQPTNNWQDATIFWSAVNAGLTPGTWQVQATDANGAVTPTPSVTVIITP